MKIKIREIYKYQKIGTQCLEGLFWQPLRPFRIFGIFEKTSVIPTTEISEASINMSNPGFLKCPATDTAEKQPFVPFSHGPDKF